MKNIVVTKELLFEEKRVAITPEFVAKYVKLDFSVYVESRLAEHLSYTDLDYEKAGAKVLSDRSSLMEIGDIHLRVSKMPLEDIPLMKKGAFHISYYDAFQDHLHTEAFLKHELTSVSIQMIPRTTLAQKMDALSSQASLAGYAAVILGANSHTKVLPMMTTPSGTIVPANVLVIGVGVAGLQAIATAKRLGANVYAFDTRPVVEEQVKSLGAKFIKIDLGSTSQTKDGYAVALSEEQMIKLQLEMEKVAAKSDLIITTAALFGRRAPLIIKKAMLKKIRKTPSPVIVDMAVETGGNVEGSVLGETVEIHGVKIIGPKNLPGYVAHDASRMYSANLYELLAHLSSEKGFEPNFKDPIFSPTVITHSGEIIHEKIAQLQGAL